MKQKSSSTVLGRMSDVVSKGYRVAKKQYDIEKQKEKIAKQQEVDKLRAELKKETVAHLNRQKKLHSSSRGPVYDNDRRCEPRYSMRSDCEIVYQRRMYSATINDISNSGASITFQNTTLSSNIYTVESEIDFVFQKKNYPICSIKGIVKNVITNADGSVRIGLQVTGGRIDVWKAIVATLEI